MISYAKVAASNSEVSQGLIWRDIPEVNESCPTAPSTSGFQRAKTTGKQQKIAQRAGEDHGCGYIPRKAFHEAKLNLELGMFTTEETEQRQKLRAAEKTFRSVMKRVLPEAAVFMLGSFAAGVDIHSSDLDFTLTLPESEVPLSTRLWQLKEVMKWSPYYKKVQFISCRVPVIKMTDCETGVDVDVTASNDNAKRNTQILAYYAMMDPRFQPLCKSIKNWASTTGVENAKMGRLNSFTICLMLISYLQTSVTPAILPCIQRYFKKLKGDCEVVDDHFFERGVKLREELKAKGKFQFGANKAGLGVLFAGFMRHYAEFDFKKNWISVKKGLILEKRYTLEGHPKAGLPKNNWGIVVEDPFLLNPWNCGGSVYAPVLIERIQSEFKKCFLAIDHYGSIFTYQMSECRRLLYADGKQKDMQKQTWQREKNLAAVDTNSWGGSTSSWDYQLFEFLEPNWKFWDEDNKVKVAFNEKIQKGPEWPLPARAPADFY